MYLEEYPFPCFSLMGKLQGKGFISSILWLRENLEHCGV